MTENRPQMMTLEDYSSFVIPQYFTSIARPDGSLFHGLPSEDLYSYLTIYIKICNMMKIAGGPEDAISLNLFSFSLAGEAKRWFRSFKGNILRTWDEMVEKFLKKYFLESKTVERKPLIASMGYSGRLLHMGLASQSSSTSSLMACNPIPSSSTMSQLVGRSTMELIENMAVSDHAILCDRAYMPTKKNAMLAQNKLLAKTLETLTTTLSNLSQQLHAMQHSPSLVMHIGRCNICGGTHESGSCMVQDNTTNYMGSQNHQGFHQGGPPDFYQRGNFSQGQGWRFHPGNNFNQGGSSYQPPSQEPSLREETTMLEELLVQFMQRTESHQMSTNVAIRNLEVQIGQLAKLVFERPTETFRVNTKMKPKEECKRRKEKKTEEVVCDEEGEKKEERERNEEKIQQWEKCSQVEIQQKIILQEERHGEHDKSLSVIFSLITNTFLAIIWKVFPGYMSFIESPTKRRKCKEVV
ncbi:hypothetical protein HKD37_07G020013 [Glycine soja]